MEKTRFNKNRDCRSTGKRCLLVQVQNDIETYLGKV